LVYEKLKYSVAPRADVTFSYSRNTNSGEWRGR